MEEKTYDIEFDSGKYGEISEVGVDVGSVKNLSSLISGPTAALPKSDEEGENKVSLISLKYQIRSGAAGKTIEIPVTISTANYDVTVTVKIDVKKTVEIEVSDTEHVYESGVARNISVEITTPGLPASLEDYITVSYYPVDENNGVLAGADPVLQAVAAGKYLYVIDFDKEDYRALYTIGEMFRVKDGDVSLPDLEEYENVGYMTIRSQAGVLKPITFAEGAVSVYVTEGTYTNELNNENTGGTLKYRSSNEEIATVAADGTVTLNKAGTVTITAEYSRPNYTTVYASYILTVSKKPVNVAAVDDSVVYGEDWDEEDWHKNTSVTYSDGLTADDFEGALFFKTNYKTGSGVGEYTITPGGLTSEKYEIEYVPAVLTVEPRELEASRFTVVSEGKTYDGTDAARASVTEMPGVLDADKNLVSVAGTAAYSSPDAGERTVTYTISRLTGAKAQNYTLKGATAVTSGNYTISPMKIYFIVGQTTFVYDGKDKEIAVYASDELGRPFSGYTIGYIDGDGKETTPNAAGTYTAEIVLNDSHNYKTSQGSIPVTVSEASQDQLFIAGLPGTVQYKDSFTLEAFGGADGGTYQWSSDNGDLTFNDDTLAAPTVTVGGAVGKKVTLKVTKSKENYGSISAKVVFIPQAKVVTFELGNLVHTYDGQRHEISFAPVEDFTPVLSGEGKNVEVTCTLTSDPSVTEPVGAGVYSVFYEITDERYTGGGTATMYINKADASITLSAENPQGAGGNRSVDLTAVVSGVNGEKPDGSVPFYNGDTALGTVELTNGTAVFTWTQVPAGSHTIKAAYGGNQNYAGAENTTTYNAGSNEQAELVIEEVTGKTFGGEPFKLEVTGGSGLGTLSYKVKSGDSVSVDETTGLVTILAAGESTIEVIKAADDNYNEAKAEVTIKIAQAVPAIEEDGAPTAARVEAGQTLSASSLSGGRVTGLDGTELKGTWAWKDGEKEMSGTGTFEKTAVFTPEDTNYAAIETPVSVTVYSSSPSGGGGGGGGGSVTSYTVTFDTQGGSSIDSVKVNRNGTVAKPEDPVREGYTFEGWFTDADCTGAYDFDTKVTKNITLYAKWTEKTTEPVDPEDPAGDGEWENPFADVAEGDWFYDYVRYAHENGLFAGVSGTEFDPDEGMTRAMIVTVLYRAEGEPATGNESRSDSFDDVALQSWYGPAVYWAQMNGIVKGYSDEVFAPDKLITREEMAAIMYRYAGYKGVDTSAAGDLSQFSDQAQIANWARGNVEWTVGYGLISGRNNGTLDPKGNITRAETAAILQRFLEK